MCSVINNQTWARDWTGENVSIEYRECFREELRKWADLNTFSWNEFSTMDVDVLRQLHTQAVEAWKIENKLK